MPRYYCDYCDTYLTHDSPVVRKQHNTGYKHKANVRNYYMQFEEAQTQDLIDSKIMEHLAKAGLGDPNKGAPIGGIPITGNVNPAPVTMRPPGLPTYPTHPGMYGSQPQQPMAYRPPAGMPLPRPGGQPMYGAPQSLPPPQMAYPR